MARQDTIFGMLDDENTGEPQVIPYDTLRNDILDRLSRGLSPSESIKSVNPFIYYRLQQNSFILPAIVYTYTTVKTPTETEKLKKKITQVLEAPAEIKEAFTEQLDVAIEEARRFFTMELAPVNLGFTSGLDEALQVIKLITEQEELSFNTRQAIEVMNELSFVRLVKFVSEKLCVDEKYADLVIRRHLDPTRKEKTNNLRSLLEALSHREEPAVMRSKRSEK